MDYQFLTYRTWSLTLSVFTMFFVAKSMRTRSKLKGLFVISTIDSLFVIRRFLSSGMFLLYHTFEIWLTDFIVVIRSSKLHIVPVLGL